MNQMKILFISPIPSHPASNSDRRWLRSFARLLKRDGHYIMFVYFGGAISKKSATSMKNFWDAFLHININWQNPQASSERPRISLDLFRGEDYDILICNYAILYERLGNFSELFKSICITNIYGPDRDSDYLTFLQRDWLKRAERKRAFLSGATLLIARFSEEARKLDKIAISPVWLAPADWNRVGKRLTNRSPGIASARTVQKVETLDALYSKLTSKRKTVLILTDRQFWDVKNAISTVLIKFIRNLNKRYSVNLLYFGSPGEEDKEKISRLSLDKLTFSTNTPTDYHIEHILASNEIYKESFIKFLYTHKRYDVIIYNFIMLAYLKECVFYKALHVLDTQDIMSVRRYSLEKGLTYDMSLYEEAAIYKQFDATMFIEESERAFAQAAEPGAIALYCPLSADIVIPPFPETGIHFGFVGSQWILNSEAIEWFLREVWIMQDRKDAILHIFGGVCKCLDSTPANVVLHGIVESEEAIFGACHIILNPTLRGSGFPTKSLAALASGRPLLASAKGARGLARSTENGIYVANNRAEHIEGLLRFSHDAAMRDVFSREAALFARRRFSAGRSYGELTRLIDNI